MTVAAFPLYQDNNISPSGWIEQFVSCDLNLVLKMTYLIEMNRETEMTGHLKIKDEFKR